MSEKDIGEIRADVKTLIEISKLTRREQEKKNELLFDNFNATNKSLERIGAVLEFHSEKINKNENRIKDHKNNHFSWVKMLGIGVSTLLGIVSLINIMSK